MRRFTVDTPDTVKSALSLENTAKDHFIIFDTPAELAARAPDMMQTWEDGAQDWDGNVTTQRALHMAANGDLAGVAKSDAMIQKFERFAFETERRGWIDSVAGGVPNVPAFIAGHPLNMRRRVKEASAAAPLAIIVDLTTTATFTAEQIARRGAAILALVRIMSARRPVELWVGTGLDADNRKSSVWVMTRIETAPLDLATAAHCLTHASFPRRLCYSISRKEHGYQGQYPYGMNLGFRERMAEIVAPAFPHITDMLCIPCMYVSDKAADEPEKWIEERLAELAPEDAAAA